MFWLTDFGQQDGYVGVMKAVVMKELARRQVKRPVSMIDVSHDIPAFDIRSGAWVLERLLPYAPDQAVFVCIVDPHVGNPGQAPLMLSCPEKAWVFLAPDNGLLTPVIQYLQALNLQFTACLLSQSILEELLGAPPDGQRTISSTFHGRDIYSPMAAWALGDISGFQPTQEICQPALLESWDRPNQIAYLDGFGNVITRLAPSDLAAALPHPPQCGQRFRVTLPQGAFTFCWRDYYQQVDDLQRNLKTEDIVGLWGSHGFLEWACPSGHAVHFLETHWNILLTPGQTFTLEAV